MLKRRIIAGGWICLVICAGLFTNVGRLPQQLERHYYASEEVVTPDNLKVLNLQKSFYTEVKPDVFSLLSFEEKNASC